MKISIIVLAAITLFIELIVGLTFVAALSATTSEEADAAGFVFLAAAGFAFLAVVLDISMGIIAAINSTVEKHRGWRAVIISSLVAGVAAPVTLFILGLIAAVYSATNSVLDSDFVLALDLLLPALVPIVAIVYVIVTRPRPAPVPVVVHPSTKGAAPATPPAVRWRPRLRPALAVSSTLGVLLTACLIGVSTLAARHATSASSPLHGLYTLFSLAYLGGLLVTAGALVWACVIAIRLKRWGWTVALVVGTLALVVATLFSAPGLLILLFAVWGPDGPRQGPPTEAGAGTPPLPPNATPGSSPLTSVE